MGGQTSTNQQRHSITHNESVDGNILSTLYLACRNGDYELVLGLLASSTFDTINRREPNGSTALHAAVECGHVDIISLLVNVYGVQRHLTDNNGHTAFDIVQTDAIRKLFLRPITDTNRFYGSESFEKMFSYVNQKNRSERLQCYNSKTAVEDQKHSELVEADSGHLVDGLKMIFLQDPIESKRKQRVDTLQRFINASIDSSHTQYAKANELLNSFRKTEKVEPLIRLYTLETPFYRYINKDRQMSDVFSSTLISSLVYPSERAFKGITYRGLGMTRTDLQEYEWALRQNDRHVELNTFASTTLDQDLAKMYAEANGNNEQQQVLMCFEFPTACTRAIQLYKLSNHLPSISEFESEQEVLILPKTVFSISRILRIESLIFIYLTNVDMQYVTDNFVMIFMASRGPGAVLLLPWFL